MYSQAQVNKMISDKMKSEVKAHATKSYIYECEIEDDIKSLQSKEKNITLAAAKENRALDPVEQSLINEIGVTIADLEEQRKMLMPQRAMTVEGNRTLDNNYGADIYTRTATNSKLNYRNLFKLRPEDRLDNGGFRNAAEFIRVIDSGRYDTRLQYLNSQQEGIPSSGGFAVPSQIAAEWLDAALSINSFRSLCKLYGMLSNTLEVPGWDSADLTSGKAVGGLQMAFLGEGDTATPQTAKMRKIELTARVAGIYADSSIELIQDGVDFATNLESALRQSMSFGIDRYMLLGTGAGQPLGALNAPCKIQVAKEVGQRAGTLVYQNLKRMFARQLNPNGAVWVVNNTIIPDLLELSIPVGTGGSHVPVLNESNGEFSIFGRPVYFSGAMPSIGTVNDVAFIDFNFYALGIRKEIFLEATDAVKWLQRERSFRVLLRFDGQPTLDKPVTPENGETLSPIVTLAARV